MLLRVRWFIVGVVASLSAVGYLAAQVRKARERLTPRNLARSGLHSVADLLDSTAEVVRTDGERA